MTREKDGFSDYVRRVRESTQQYAKDLLHENEQLLGLAMSVHDEKLRLETELESTREQLKRQGQLESSLVERIAGMEESNRQFAERYVDIEQLTSNMTNLYVATYRLHGSLEREHVLTTMKEIVINLVGSEEFAIFECAGPSLSVACSMGVEEDHLLGSHPTAGNVRDAVARGAIFVAEQNGVSRHDGDVSACIPLQVEGRLVGAIVIFRLLSHKGRYEPLDHELFNLLATHAATALHSSALHARLAHESAA